LESIWDILAKYDILPCSRPGSESSYEEDIHHNQDVPYPDMIKSYLFSCIRYNEYEYKEVLIHISGRLSNRLQYSLSVQQEIDPPKFGFDEKTTINDINTLQSTLEKRFLLCLRSLGYNVY
jgi:hypothetical protein